MTRSPHLTIPAHIEQRIDEYEKCLLDAHRIPDAHPESSVRLVRVRAAHADLCDEIARALAVASTSEVHIKSTRRHIEPHYGADLYEPIKIIEYYGLGFHLGNALKYLLRAGKKQDTNLTTDLFKAENYLHRTRTGEWLPSETSSTAGVPALNEETCATCGWPMHQHTIHNQVLVHPMVPRS